MSAELEGSLLDQLILFRPARIRQKARLLRDRSRKCADLASNSVTEEGKQVLNGLSVELQGEADELESALLMIRRIYAESFANEPAEDEA